MPFKAHPFGPQPILPTYLLSSSLHFCHAGTKLIHLLVTPNLYSLDLIAYMIVLNQFYPTKTEFKYFPSMKPSPDYTQGKGLIFSFDWKHIVLIKKYLYWYLLLVSMCMFRFWPCHFLAV